MPAAAEARGDPSAGTPWARMTTSPGCARPRARLRRPGPAGGGGRAPERPPAPVRPRRSQQLRTRSRWGARFPTSGPSPITSASPPTWERCRSRSPPSTRSSGSRPARSTTSRSSPLPASRRPRTAPSSTGRRRWPGRPSTLHYHQPHVTVSCRPALLRDRSVLSWYAAESPAWDRGRQGPGGSRTSP